MSAAAEDDRIVATLGALLAGLGATLVAAILGGPAAAFAIYALSWLAVGAIRARHRFYRAAAEQHLVFAVGYPAVTQLVRRPLHRPTAAWVAWAACEPLARHMTWGKRVWVRFSPDPPRGDSVLRCTRTSAITRTPLYEWRWAWLTRLLGGEGPVWRVWISSAEPPDRAGRLLLEILALHLGPHLRGDGWHPVEEAAMARMCAVYDAARAQYQGLAS